VGVRVVGGGGGVRVVVCASVCTATGLWLSSSWLLCHVSQPTITTEATITIRDPSLWTSAQLDPSAQAQPSLQRVGVSKGFGHFEARMWECGAR